MERSDSIHSLSIQNKLLSNAGDRFINNDAILVLNAKCDVYDEKVVVVE
jgi:hypothetical protein